MAKKPKGLGRGLDDLLGEDLTVAAVLGKSPERTTATPQSVLPLDVLQAGRYQPRGRMDEGALAELADSIRQHGVMQPILVRALSDPGRFEIIAGERRFRAAQLAGLTEVPVLVREVSDEAAAVMALIENMQREDLNPLEEAQGIHRLINDFGLTHEQAAHALGRSRSAVSNLLRLLQLAEPVQTMLLAGDIDMGHARALLALDAAGQLQIAQNIIARRLSVRDTEKAVRSLVERFELQPSRRPASSPNRDLSRLEETLSDYLGTAVQIRHGAKDKGQLQISFHGWDHLSGLLERIGFDPEAPA